MTPEDGGQAGGMEEDLAAWGKTITLETTGRRSGQIRRVSLGFVETADGDLLVAASDEASDWARNLFASPQCHVVRSGTRRACRAEPLEGRARQEAIVALILKYGTPSERLGGGPAFRLIAHDAESHVG